ncbi:MAG: rod shape-determining protein [Deltaproteobacteria bacterium]|jgi:rod shape-determining protein MreB|nr:rod shape-determining protein [Deltaproteobacteria bacterium]
MKLLHSLFGFLSSDLAVDLGTANTLVYLRGKGVVLFEPSVVAVRANGKGSKVLAVGGAARDMLGRCPENIRAVRPLKDGVIADFEIAQAMLRHFISFSPFKKIFKPRVIVAVPSGITQVEKKAVREAAEQAGAAEVFLIEEPMAAAIGAGLPITEPAANMIVDIGGGTTEVAVISLAGIVYSKSVRVGGDKMDEAIVQYVRKKYNLLIGERMAETIKREIGAAYPADAVESREVKGRDTVTGLPKAVSVDSEEIRTAISEQVEAIVTAVRSALERTPPELAADIVSKGIVLTGGGALLKRLDTLIAEETRLPVSIAEDPLRTVALGSGRALENLDVLREIAIQ